MNLKLVLILAVLVFGLGYYTAQTFNKPGEVTKVVDNVITKIKTVTTPGQTITETVIVEKKVQEQARAVEQKKPDYGIGGGLSTEGYYGSISRRMIGDLWLEAAGNMKGTLSIGVRYEF